MFNQYPREVPEGDNPGGSPRSILRPSLEALPSCESSVVSDAAWKLTKLPKDSISSELAAEIVDRLLEVEVHWVSSQLLVFCSRDDICSDASLRGLSYLIVTPGLQHNAKRAEDELHKMMKANAASPHSVAESVASFTPLRSADQSGTTRALHMMIACRNIDESAVQNPLVASAISDAISIKANDKKSCHTNAASLFKSLGEFRLSLLPAMVEYTHAGGHATYVDGYRSAISHLRASMQPHEIEILEDIDRVTMLHHQGADPSEFPRVDHCLPTDIPTPIQHLRLLTLARFSPIRADRVKAIKFLARGERAPVLLPAYFSALNIGPEDVSPIERDSLARLSRAFPLPGSKRMLWSRFKGSAFQAAELEKREGIIDLFMSPTSNHMIVERAFLGHRSVMPGAGKAYEELKKSLKFDTPEQAKHSKTIIYNIFLNRALEAAPFYRADSNEHEGLRIAVMSLSSGYFEPRLAIAALVKLYFCKAADTDPKLERYLAGHLRKLLHKGPEDLRTRFMPILNRERS